MTRMKKLKRAGLFCGERMSEALLSNFLMALPSVGYR